MASKSVALTLVNADRPDVSSWLGLSEDKMYVIIAVKASRLERSHSTTPNPYHGRAVIGEKTYAFVVSDVT
jgi:hypothetical protein